MSFEQPNQKQEGLGNVAERVSAVSKELAERRADGLNSLFSPEAAEKFSEIAQALQSGNNENIEAIAGAFEKEIQEFGQHTQGAIIDNLDSLRKMTNTFADLSKELVDSNPESNPNIQKMAELAHAAAEALNKKTGYLEEYLNGR